MVRNARSVAVVSFVELVLLILGAPAAVAAAPTITSFNPTSGPIGTSVTITGTGFQDASVVTNVEFNSVDAVFTVNSDVQITATVPAGATDGPIEVTDSEGTGPSATNFDVTPSPLPTITSFTPASGPGGTSVVIIGTGFTGATAVTFDGVSTAFIFNSDTQITATAPSAATTGPIAVTTPGGTATSSTNFTVEPHFDPERHRSNVTLRLRVHLVATGQVNVPDGTDACEHRRLVKVQRRSEGNWRTVGMDRTSANGSYRERLPDREGKYRSALSGSRLANGDICLGDVSRRRIHNHPDEVVSGGGDDGANRNCTSGYSPCLVYHGGADYDCAGGSGDGPYYTEPGVVYSVTGSDPYGLDADNDGRGCE